MKTITGRGGLPLVRIETPWSAAEIYLHGASVTHFQLHGEPPLLFLSEKSRFEKDAPIRGGIPIIFPWFGPHPSDPKKGQHGFARSTDWKVESKSDNEIALRLEASDATRAATIVPSIADSQIRRFMADSPGATCWPRVCGLRGP